MAEEGWKPKEGHLYQIMFYLWKLQDKYPGIEGRILYVSRDDLTIHEIPVKYDKGTMDFVLRSIDVLNESIKNKKAPVTIPDIVLDAKGKWRINWQAKFCSHHALCMNDVQWEQKAEEKIKEKNVKIKKTK